MKKMLTVLLSVLCVMSIACAAEPDTKTTNVSYEVTQAYEWTVPVGTIESPIAMTATISELGDVTVTKCLIADGKKLDISIASEDWKVEYAEDEVSYEISKSNTTWAALANDDIVLSVAAGKAVKGSGDDPLVLATAEVQKLYSKVTGSPVKAGKYVDQLTFTAVVGAAS